MAGIKRFLDQNRSKAVNVFVKSENGWRLLNRILSISEDVVVAEETDEDGKWLTCIALDEIVTASVELE